MGVVTIALYPPSALIPWIQIDGVKSITFRPGSPNQFVEGREAPLLFWARPSLLSIGFDRVALKNIYLAEA